MRRPSSEAHDPGFTVPAHIGTARAAILDRRYNGRMQERIILPARKRLLAVLGVSLAGLLVSLTAALSTESRVDSLLWGCVALPLCLVASLIIAARLTNPRPLLRLDETGLTENSTLLSPGFLAWSEIAGADVYDHFGQRFLRIRLADPHRVQARLPSWQRLLVRLNRAGTNVILAVPESLLGCDVVPLAGTIDRLAGHGSPRRMPGVGSTEGGRPRCSRQ